jgi:hypothetical protein
MVEYPRLVPGYVLNSWPQPLDLIKTERGDNRGHRVLDLVRLVVLSSFMGLDDSGFEHSQMNA